MKQKNVKSAGNIKRILAAALAGAMFLGVTACGADKDNNKNTKEEVVVYTAVDQVFADRIFEMFEKETGIKVSPVYDTEANKTTGLTNRIIAEKERPVCDVFWNNEFIQTLDLDEKGMLEAYESPSAKDIPSYYKDPENHWAAYGGRARVLLVNTGMLTEEQYPTTIYDFTSGKYPGDQLALAYPMFGTTRTMAAAIYAQSGEQEGRAYFEKVKANGVRIVDGNSVTKDMAATGQVAIGFTDTDDAKEAIEDGAPVTMVYPDQEEGGIGTLITPASAAIIKGAPHKDAAEKFMDFVLSEKVERKLVKIGFFDRSVRDEGKDGGIRGMTLKLDEIYKYLAVASKDMEEIFSSAK